MSREEEFAGRVRIEMTTLRVWLDKGWIVPSQVGDSAVFRDVDVARAALIRDLDDLMGINNEGIDVVLGLVDQLHMRRHDFDMMVEVLRAAGTEQDSAQPRRCADKFSTSPKSKVATLELPHAIQRVPDASCALHE